MRTSKREADVPPLEQEAPASSGELPRESGTFDGRGEPAQGLSAADLGLSEEQLLAIADSVRHGVGRDLHDGLGQLLAGAALMARALEHQVGENLQPQLGRLVETLNDAILRVQRIARGLAPVGLQGLTTVQALESLCATVQATHAVECSLEFCASPANESEATKLQIYLIAQEAIRNALRHGKATRIEIGLELLGAQSTLTIHDNGSGVHALANAHGFGLESMLYRARALGGTLTVTRLEPHGTAVRCVWPTPEAPESAATP
jgi:two-component system sensor kinase FixL